MRERAGEVAGVLVDGRTVDGVGAGLGKVVDDRTCVATILSAETVGDDLNFGDCLVVAKI